MRKLKLDLDSLDVTSFATRAAEAEPGTVAGHALLPVLSKYPCASINAPCLTNSSTCCQESSTC